MGARLTLGWLSHQAGGLTHLPDILKKSWLVHFSRKWAILILDEKIWVTHYFWKLSVKGIHQNKKKNNKMTGPFRSYIGHMLQLARVQRSKWARTCCSARHNNVPVMCRRVTESLSAAAAEPPNALHFKADDCSQADSGPPARPSPAPGPRPFCFTRRQMLPAPLFTSRRPTKSFAPLHGDARQIFEVCSQSFLNKALII